MAIKRKITDEELAERRKNIRDAEILASLDNDAEYSDDFLELQNQYANGDITYKEFHKKVMKL